MKTKELIKLLQDVDSSGEAYLRINGHECIVDVEYKPGYWDGPYSYLSKNTKGEMVWNESNRGMKVDIRVMEMFDFVERYKGDYKKVMKHVKMDFQDLNPDDRIKRFQDLIKQECKEYNEMVEKLKKLKIIKTKK
jgi:hypothetical protein